MKYCINYIIIFSLISLASCYNEYQSTETGKNTVNFTVSPINDTIAPGESITIFSYLEDTVIIPGSNPALPDNKIVWLLLTGGGTIQETGNNNIIYHAPPEIQTPEVLAVLQAVPNMDMRYSKLVYITIKGEPAPVDTGICFSRDVLPIFNSNCAKSGCHDAITHKEGYNLSSYETIISRGIKPGEPQNSKVFKNLSRTGEEPMPPYPNTPLNAEQIETIRRWIAEGAVNKDCTSEPPPGGCDTINITYGGTIRKILELNCTGCHSGSPPQGNVDLTTYNNVKTRIDNGSLYGAIIHDPKYIAMPGNSVKLPDCSIVQIRKWIEQGAPNN